MSWTIRTRPDAFPADRVEARRLVASLQAADSARMAEEIRLHVGRHEVPLKSLVSLERQDDADDTIRLNGDFSRWDGLGFGLTGGRLIVEGDTGARTAAELAGGTVEIHGNCGSWAGAAMAAGRLVIHGDAGDWLGSNWPGEARGMTGGEIYVLGRAGDHVGVRMRRGMIAVARQAGEGVGRAMIAGSILLGGGCSGLVGLGMKRGTIVLGGETQGSSAISATGFPRADAFRPLTLGIQLRHAAAAGWKTAEHMARTEVAARYLGDRLNHGLGEIFVLSNSAKLEEGAR
jgi:formylmethanofuran dehydrogenase subunit C